MDKSEYGRKRIDILNVRQIIRCIGLINLNSNRFKILFYTDFVFANFAMNKILLLSKLFWVKKVSGQNENAVEQ